MLTSKTKKNKWELVKKEKKKNINSQEHFHFPEIWQFLISEDANFYKC